MNRRPPHDPPPPAANDLPPGVGVITAEQLSTIVSNAVAAALANGVQAQPATRLLSAAELGKALSVSPSLVGKLRRAGMPSLRVGDAARYDVDACIEWLRDNQKVSNQ